MSELPEACIADVLSCTDPREACRLSIVSSEFSDAARSDTVWERFLPPDYQSILLNSDSASLLHHFPSKKQLYLSLCDNPILIGDRKTSFSLDKVTGKKIYMISARSLTIIWGDTPRYWRWNSDTDSRFGETAELLNVCWLEIRGKMKTSMLSAAKTYCVYLVYKLRRGAHGFGHRHPLLEVAVGVVDGGEFETSKSRCSALDGKKRKDGWVEIELGELLTEKGGDGELEASIMEVRGGHWKGGLLVQGIEIRPKSAN